MGSSPPQVQHFARRPGRRPAIRMRNLGGTCQAAARSMKAGARAGKIITISSGAYASGRVGASHYCASKAGVVMFTRVLAMELAEQRINVNCIAPGYIKVDSGTSPPSSDFETALIENTPWGRLGTPADIAPAALFLASPEADYVTGEVLAVNGGGFSRRPLQPPRTPQSGRSAVGLTTPQVAGELEDG